MSFACPRTVLKFYGHSAAVSAMVEKQLGAMLRRVIVDGNTLYFDFDDGGSDEFVTLGSAIHKSERGCLRRLLETARIVDDKSDCDGPKGLQERTTSVDVLRRAALNPNTNSNPLLPQANTVVIFASLIDGDYLDVPKATINPLPPDVQKLVLSMTIDTRHPLLPAATISCWHHCSTLTEVVLIATASSSRPPPTDLECAQAKAILETRNFFRYQPALGILYRPLSTLALSSTTAKVTLVGFDSLRLSALGFSESQVRSGRTIQTRIEAVAKRQFPSLTVRCIDRDEYAQQIGEDRFRLETEW